MALNRSYETLPVVKYWGRCLNRTDTRYTKIYEKHSVSNPTDSRGLPDKPLWAHPTPLKKQYTSRGSLHIEKKLTTGNEYCNGVLSPTKHTLQYYYVVKREIPRDSVWPNTSWETEARLRIAQATVNLGSNIAEFRQTCNSFYDTAVGLKNIYRALRGRGWSRRRAMDVPAAWLNTNYALAPLVGDMSDSVLALNNALDRDIVRKIAITKTARDTNRDWFGLKAAERVYVSQDRAIVYVRLDPRSSRISAGNPLEWAWEAIPFSFVVDWMVPIGNSLQALDALRNVAYLRGTLTEKRTMSAKYVSPVNSGYTVEQTGRWDYKSHQRHTLSTIPLPDFPSWEPSESFRTVTNGLALLAVLRGR